MANEDGYEDFDINETDFQYAMNPGNYRRMSKKKQIYGVWASDSEDEGDARPSFSGSNSKKPNYTQPVSFISGGIQGGKKDEEQQDEDKEVEIEEKPPLKKSKPLRPSFQKQQKGAQVFAGMRSSTTKGSVDLNAVGEFLKAGTGSVIMNMMEKMGYQQGKGLGAQKQGIVEPIQPKVRPGRGAVGAYGTEAKGPKFGETAAEAQRRERDGAGEGDSTAEIVPEIKRENWKKSNAKRAKIHYKTLEEVISEGGEVHKYTLNSGQSMKIIDMTGPQQRVYNDFNSFSRRAVAPDMDSERTNFDVPELMFNLNILVNITEEEILRNDRQIRFLKDQNVALEMEEENLKKSVIEEREEIRRMNDVVGIIEEFESLSQGKELSLEDCKRLFVRLKKDFPAEYQLYGLDVIAVANVLPLIKSYFSKWNPLDIEQADYGTEILNEWRQILQGTKTGMFDHFKNDLDSLPVYDRCVWEGWMPSIRRAALNWDPRTDDQHVMITLIENWLDLLPGWISENLLEQVIIPRIKDVVDQWNPLTDHIPIDSWLLSWHPIMGDRLQPVYPIIRQKLAKALRDWAPSDRSALGILKPWKLVFSQGSMQSFLSMNIVPKLERFLAEMDLDPTRNKEYLEFYAVLNWLELISIDIICQILVKNFFPRWYENLCFWLDAGGVLAEIGEYYKEWKTRVPPNLAELKPIKDEFLRALVAMQQASKGLKVSKISIPTGPTPLMQTPVPPPGLFAPRPPQPSPALINVPTTFRQVVEQRARQLGILFVPQPNKYEEGKQVYSFGKMSIFFESNVVYAFDTIRRQWNPISLDHLISIC